MHAHGPVLMASEATTRDQQNRQQQQAQLEHHIHDAISPLTTLSTPSRASSTSLPMRHRRTIPGESTERGVRLITIAGKNKGATMKTDCSEVLDSTSGVMYSDARTMSAITNSNFQAINNSVMLKDRCVTGDTGVHLVIDDDGRK